MNRTFFYVAAALVVLSAVSFGLTFTVLGIYALISSILLGIAALAFVSAQQKKEKFKALLFVKIAAYAVLATAVLFFIGGTIYSQTV